MVVAYLKALSTLICFIIGFLIAIPIGSNQSSHHGNCFLYADLVTKSSKKKSHGSKGSYLYPGSNLTCDFCIFSGTVSLIVALVLFLVAIYGILQNSFRTFNFARYIGDTERNRKRNKPLIGAWIQFCAAAVMSLLTFVTACLISSGFHDFCEKGLRKIHEDLDNCYLLEKHVGSFYKDFSIAQISAWIGALFWIVVTVTGRINVRQLKPKRLQCTDDDYQKIESPVHL